MSANDPEPELEAPSTAPIEDHGDKRVVLEKNVGWLGSLLGLCFCILYVYVGATLEQVSCTDVDDTTNREVRIPILGIVVFLLLPSLWYPCQNVDFGILNKLPAKFKNLILYLSSAAYGASKFCFFVQHSF